MNSLKNPISGGSAVGLDLQGDYLGAVQVTQSVRGLRVDKTWLRELPDRSRLKEELGEFVLNTRIGRESVATCLPAAETMIREIPISFDRPGKARKIIKYQMESRIAYPVEDVVADCIFDGQKGFVWGFAVPKDLLSAHLDLLSEAGIQPDAVGSEVMALYHLYLWRGGEQREEPVAVVRMESVASLILVIHEGRMTFLRVVQAGPAHGEVLRESLRLYALKCPDAGLRQILLTGRSAARDGNLQRVAETTGLPTRLWLPFDGIAKERLGDDMQAQLTGALGLALGTLKKPHACVEFRREEFARRPYGELKGTVIFMVAAVLTLLALLTFDVFWDLRQKEREYTELRRRISQVLQETFPDTAHQIKGQERAQMQQLVADHSERFLALEAVTGRGGPLNVLLVLTRILRQVPGTVLESLTLEGKKLSLDGRATSFQSVDKLKGQLSGGGDFQGVRMVGAKMDNREAVVRFQFVMEKKE
ncbi:MAG: PilN domain-containing protein [Deltaproteobacteria bacterium]|nr:PilN domain-containing protein [Deltaproteobacteria bacterium]